MKKTPVGLLTFKACALAFLLFCSFSTVRGPVHAGAMQKAFKPAEPVEFFTTITGVEGTTYTGIVEATGGIQATGTYRMPTKSLGMALHCELTLYLPGGTIMIKMNCNMHTFRGRWQIEGGTGAYSRLSGNGPLVMPDEIHEVLTGTIHWK
jgi:hypothetical protein